LVLWARVRVERNKGGFAAMMTEDNKDNKAQKKENKKLDITDIAEELLAGKEYEVPKCGKRGAKNNINHGYISDVYGSDNKPSKSDQQSRQRNHQSEEEEQEQNKSKPKRQYPAYKYSNKGKIALHEAIIMSSSGQPLFLRYDNSKIGTVDRVQEANRVIVPYSYEEYPYEPYEFANLEEISIYLKRAKETSIDDLFSNAKSIVRKYNDQDAHKLDLLAADIIWSYFQDKFSTTHYVAIVGGNGSGKTTMGDTFAEEAYRTVSMTDPSAANIFRVLGQIEYGQCTIFMDEAEKIDKSPDLMSILKTGYQFSGKVAKMNMNLNETQQWFYPYCLKYYVAERLPNQSDAKGVLDRTFSYTAYKGKPEYDIKEILNPAGNERRQKLLDELVDFRKLMLTYRLIHFQDPIPDIDIQGLEGRDKELCKPLLQLFYNTKSYKEIKSTLQMFLDAKNQKKSNLIEAALLPIVANLLSAFTHGNGNSHKKELRSSIIWDNITQGSIEGHYDEKKPNEYQTADYGTIYRNTITNIICDKFGAEKRHDRNGSTLKFDVEKLVKVAKSYDLEIDIQTEVTEFQQPQEGIEDKGNDSNNVSTAIIGDGCDDCDGSIEAMDHYNEKNNLKNANSNLNNCENSNNNATTPANTLTQTESREGILYQELSQPSHPSQFSSLSSSTSSKIPDYTSSQIRPEVVKAIYRLGYSDLFACKNCNVKGDKWFMLKHPQYCKAGNQLTKQNSEVRK
jgi:hypothetical protein